MLQRALELYDSPGAESFRRRFRRRRRRAEAVSRAAEKFCHGFVVKGRQLQTLEIFSRHDVFSCVFLAKASFNI